MRWIATNGGRELKNIGARWCLGEGKKDSFAHGGNQEAYAKDKVMSLLNRLLSTTAS